MQAVFARVSQVLAVTIRERVGDSASVWLIDVRQTGKGG